jgi:polyisoprenoid-binding protein YceI
MTVSTTETANSTTIWQIDRSHTHVEFAVRHLMISTVRGQFSEVAGTVTALDGDFSRAQIDATIGIASIDTRDPQRDGHLKSPDFFDVERYPTMTFKSRDVERSAGKENGYLVFGDLTLHGVTRAIALDVTVEGQTKDPYGNTRAGLSATGKLSRKDFGLVWNMVLETGGVAVGDEVKISIDAELIAQPK